MTNTDMSKEREAFEAHWLKEGNPRNSLAKWQDSDGVPLNHRGTYVMACTRYAWSAFQAGRASLQSPGFSAEDMATASAQGFRDGVASLAANAGGEPVIGWHAFPHHLQHPDGRLLRTASDLLARHGYTGCAEPLRAMSDVLLPTNPSPPEGMAVTAAMIDAGKKMLHNSNGRGAREKVERIFNAMIAAADIATASAQGFRDGVASISANAESEPVYQARYQKGFWQDSSRERCEYLQNPENTCAEDWETRILYTRPPTSAEGVEHG